MAETKRRRFEPVPCFFHLKGEILAVLLLDWDMVGGVAKDNTDRQSLSPEVQGVHLERLNT